MSAGDAQTPRVPKVKTGVPGLDHVSTGGFPHEVSESQVNILLAQIGQIGQALDRTAATRVVIDS